MDEDRLVKRLYREGRISMVEGGWCDRVEKVFRLLGCGVVYMYGPYGLEINGIQKI